MTTATSAKASTVQGALERSNAGEVEDALRRVNPGNMLASVQVTVTGLTEAAAVDITAAATKAAATIVGIDLDTDENLPAIGVVQALRVTAGTAAAGVRVVTDAAGTPDATAGQLAVATLSLDGTTLTFEAGVTAFVLVYQPRAAVDLTTDFAPNT